MSLSHWITKSLPMSLSSCWSFHVSSSFLPIVRKVTFVYDSSMQCSEVAETKTSLTHWVTRSRIELSWMIIGGCKIQIWYLSSNPFHLNRKFTPCRPSRENKRRSFKKSFFGKQKYRIDIALLLISHRHLSQVCQERPIRGANVAIKEIASDRKKN